MRGTHSIFPATLLLVAGLLFFIRPLALAQTDAGGGRVDLQRKIKESAAELEKVNKEVEETQRNIKETQNQSQTLKRELNIIQTNVRQLNLNIESDRINIKKLNLEIESLNYDLGDIRGSMVDKREAAGKLIREIHERGSQSVVFVFLKAGSLSEWFQEAQTLSNVSAQLALDIGKLRDLQAEYNEKLGLANEKRSDVAFHQKNLEGKAAILADQKSERENLLRTTKNQESAYQKNLDDLKKRQQEIASEVEEIENQLRQNIDPSLLPIPRPGVLLLPVPGGRLSQDYGLTGFAQTGYKGKWHNGIDIAAPVGTPVLAAESGTVIATGNQDSYCYKGAYGKYIVIEHGNNLTTLYGHLSLQTVKPGQAISRGDLIGYVGRTGYATGPHLHLTVFAKQTFIMKPSRSCGPMPVGGDLNPQKYL